MTIIMIYDNNNNNISKKVKKVNQTSVFLMLNLSDDWID